MHLATGCQMLAGNDYLKIHNKVSKVLMTTWPVKRDLKRKASIGTSLNGSKEQFEKVTW